MQASFCPNAVAWGDAATWAAAVIGLAGSAAVFYLGWQAQRLAYAQARQAEESRRREAFVVLRLMSPDVMAIISKVDVYATWLKTGFPLEDYLRVPRLRESVAEAMAAMRLPVVESLLGRIHVLDPHYAQAAAHAVACLMVLKHVSETAIGNPQDPEHQADFDKRNAATLALLQTEISLLLESLQLLRTADLVHLQKEHRSLAVALKGAP